MKNEPMNSSERVVFEPFKIEGRTIYPIVDVFVINDSLNFLSVSPVALVVEEKEDRYILKITHQEIDDDKLFELISSYKRKLN